MITWLVYVCLGWWGTFEFNWDTQRGLWLGIQGHKHGIVQQFKGRNENVVHHNNTVLFKNSCSKKSARIQLPRAQGYWKVLCPTSNTTHWTPLSWGNASTWPRIQSQRTVVMMRRVSRLNLLYQVSYCNNLKTVPGHWRSKDSKPQQIMTSKSWEGGWFVEFVFHLIHEHWRAAKRSLGRKKKSIAEWDCQPWSSQRWNCWFVLNQFQFGTAVRAHPGPFSILFQESLKNDPPQFMRQFFFAFPAGVGHSFWLLLHILHHLTILHHFTISSWLRPCRPLKRTKLGVNWGWGQGIGVWRMWWSLTTSTGDFRYFSKYFRIIN